jgi:acetamidase/formamidase
MGCALDAYMLFSAGAELCISEGVDMPNRLVSFCFLRYGFE